MFLFFLFLFYWVGIFGFLQGWPMVISIAGINARTAARSGRSYHREY